MNRCAHFLRLGTLCMLLAPAAFVPALAAGAGQALLTSKQLSRASGEQIYRHVCQACHMPGGRGADGAGQFPALANNPRLASTRYMVSVLLMGRSDMPSFRVRPDLRGFAAKNHVTLSDGEIARVVNYVRSHFGNHYTDMITPADVAAMYPAKESTP